MFTLYEAGAEEVTSDKAWSLVVMVSDPRGMQAPLLPKLFFAGVGKDVVRYVHFRVVMV